MKMQEHTGSGQGTFSVCLGLFKAMENGLLTLDKSPCWKMGISLHERITRRATSMVRRGNLLLFLSFRRWRLKIQHANFATEQKYGKRICEMKIWLQKGREVSLFKQYLTAIHLQSPLTLCMPLTSSLRIWRHLKNHKGTQNEKRPSHNQVPKIQKKKEGGKGLTSLTVKLSITKCQISKERLEGVNKWGLGNQRRNLGKMPIISSQISGPTPKYSSLQTWKIHNTVTTHSQDNLPLQSSQKKIPKPLHSQKFQTSPTLQMKHHPSLKGFA